MLCIWSFAKFIISSAYLTFKYSLVVICPIIQTGQTPLSCWHKQTCTRQRLWYEKCSLCYSVCEIDWGLWWICWLVGRVRSSAGGVHGCSGSLFFFYRLCSLIYRDALMITINVHSNKNIVSKKIVCALALWQMVASFCEDLHILHIKMVTDQFLWYNPF